MFVSKKLIYEAVQIFDEEKPEFNCYNPCFTGDFQIVDCWVCTKEGEIHPGYNHYGVPISVECIGEVVGEKDA